MLRIEHWLAWLAAVMLLIAIAANPPSRDAKADQPNPDRPAAAASHGLTQKPELKPIAPAPIASPAKETGEARPADLESSRLKITDLLLALFTGTLALNAYGLWRSNTKLWLVSERQIAIAEKSLRPWVSISPKIESALEWNELEASIALAITVKNVGRDPAFDVQVRAKELLIGANETLLGEEMARVRKAIRRVQTFHDPKAIVLFPDQAGTPKRLMRYARDDIGPARESANAASIRPIVLLCADYRSATTERWHQTAAAFYIVRRASPEGTPGAFPVGETVPADFIELFSEPSASFAD